MDYKQMVGKACRWIGIRSIGIVSVPVPKKLLMKAGFDDCYTLARSYTAILGSSAKVTFDAISKTCSYLTLDL
ncbi:40S ribosomal protein S2 [Cricetulus griseus]|uniref:40S ribosomal protein S2 n=1 Tax=Cricetulus griseus TaxID=10029 RepID=G3H2L1_CRIGR|nr:40S ribosomal protein S2 [Cricetulus griseus]ERE66063.1 40S ribosomal protein S2 [Cricetulus griseus]